MNPGGMAEGRDEVGHPEVRILQGREARLLEASSSPPGRGGLKSGEGQSDNAGQEQGHDLDSLT